MVTLHVLQLLADNGFGTMDQDLFWEEVPIDSEGNAKDGVWIMPRGAPLTRFDIGTQPFDIYSRFSNKITGSAKLESILIFLQSAYDNVCELPIVPEHSDRLYTDVRLKPTSGIEDVGKDENNKIVRVISGEVKYKEG